ncbi:MAG: NAD(P)/FAD-dependent oxidoreductase [Chloroflexota bacterium]
MIPSSAQVVVIGGGVHGLSTAYYLAKSGLTDVVLLEKEAQLASGSTGLSAGGIRQQFSTAVNIRMSQYSVQRFEHFKEEMDADPGLMQVGYLFLLSTEQEVALFRQSVALQNRLGTPTEWLTPEDVLARWPFFNVDDILAATYNTADGYGDPYGVAMGYAQQARRLGARILLEVEVTGIDVVGGRVRGVQTTRGPIATEVVVNTPGPHAHQVGKMAGVNLPAHPYRRQVHATAPYPELANRAPFTIDFHYNWYFRPEGPGLITGMSDLDQPPGFDLTVDRGWMEKVIEHGVYRVPMFEEARIMRSWAGLYSITPDSQPIMGAIPGVKGFICAVGWSGHGFMMAPASGLTLSEIILHGAPQTFDISEFSITRFQDPAALKAEKYVI